MDLAPWYNDYVSPTFIDNRNQLMALLNQESSLMEIVKLIGSDLLPDDQKLTLEIARVIRLGSITITSTKCRGSDHWVSMERCTQKGVAWECPRGSGVRVKGSEVRASWTAHKRR